jgi:hypothetical protein
LNKKITELNRLLYQFDLSSQNGKAKNISQFGINNYLQIAEIRDEIIKIMAKDYLDMPKVESFFKKKINE